MDEKLLALKLADDFLKSIGTKGWSYTFKNAKSHLTDGTINHKEWVVVIQYSKDGAVLDGPAILIVDIESGHCNFR